MADGCEVRKSIQLSPISSEIIDSVGNVFVYNFGWVKETRQTFLGGSDGQGMYEHSYIGVSGMGKDFVETVKLELCPPGFSTPDNDDDKETGKYYTYVKQGVKARTSIRTRAIGESEIFVLTQTPFYIFESKDYGEGEGDGIGSDSSLKPEIDSIPGGFTVISANNVKTTTEYKG